MLVFLFPGQGAQSPNMLSDFSEEKIVRDTFEEASDELSEDWWRKLVYSSSEILEETINAQIIMFLVGVSLWRYWKKEGGLIPQFLAGHSLGEYSALVASGMLSFVEALHIVDKRAFAMFELIQNNHQKYGMLAVLGLVTPKEISLWCQECSSEKSLVAPASFNTDRQFVVSGQRSALNLFSKKCHSLGLKTVFLKVSGPFHTSLMHPVAEYMQQLLSSVIWKKCQIPLIYNQDAALHETSDLVDVLAGQSEKPVMWSESLLTLDRWGVTSAIESSPHPLLVNMAKKVCPLWRVSYFPNRSSIKAIISDMND